MKHPTRIITRRRGPARVEALRISAWDGSILARATGKNATTARQALKQTS